MPVPFTIKVTNLILKKAMYCGTDKDDIRMIGENCAIALAIRDLFPEALVTGCYIFPFGADEDFVIELPKVAKDFIKVFDSLSQMPLTRLLLPAFEFTIELSDAIISHIDIGELETNFSRIGEHNS